MECEAKKMMLVICLETLNIEWGQIDPNGHRRVKRTAWLGLEIKKIITVKSKHSLTQYAFPIDLKEQRLYGYSDSKRQHGNIAIS